ncbi:MAG: DNA polymerase III subunit delta [Deltaproteobacteria bacterium]|nr:DNA polymerase III subunit delta [Deltaproteobacteria bacterium]
MNIESLIQSAASKTPPVVMVVGDQRLLVTRAMDAVRAATVGTGPRGLNEDQFDGTQDTAATVVNAARSLPMMAKVRLVFVRNVDQWKADTWDEMLRYFENPSPSTVLLMAADKLHGSLKAVTFCKKKSWFFEAKDLEEGDIGPWLSAEIKRRHVRIAPGAAELLALSVGADLGALTDALERLSIFAGDREITDEDVEATIKTTRESGPFELSQAVADKNIARCMSILVSLARPRGKDQEIPALVVMALVYRQIRLMSLVRDALDRSEDPTRPLHGKMPPHAARTTVTQARAWSSRALLRALELCADTERKLKGSSSSKGLEWRALENLALALCH